MTSSSSDPQPGKVLCSEPWTGLLAIQTNMDVTFCPCFLKQKIGNLKESTIQEVWNADLLVELRRSFSAGELPAVCRGQLCPPALGQGLPR